ncbi:FHA domain-containing protein [Myxococcus fulvus]|uniref:FHA domain-containing protein n=1 Tax=Myxococcus fulvus TaxID=33 RepID=UPI00200A3C55|nr:FHA domain-containing protein [Myxococcus fulvus]MCK8496352.1 FHA domain-containing protein [Myxococcus fulvus]
MNRTPRQVEIADPLWKALETMSREMGVDRDVLVNQAVFSLARQFGFIQPTQVSLTETGSAPAVVAAPVPAVVAQTPVATPAVVAQAPAVSAPAAAPSVTTAPAAAEPVATPPATVPPMKAPASAKVADVANESAEVEAPKGAESEVVAERVREVVRAVDQSVEVQPPPAVALADTDEEESKTGEHEGTPGADDAEGAEAKAAGSAKDSDDEEAEGSEDSEDEPATEKEPTVDEAELREAVAARVRDIVGDVDRLVEPVDAKPDEDDDEDSDDDSDEDTDDDEDSDDDSDEDSGDDEDSDDDSDEDSDEKDSDDDSDEDSDDDSDEDSDEKDSDDDSDEDSDGDADEKESGDDDSDADDDSNDSDEDAKPAVGKATPANAVAGKAAVGKPSVGKAAAASAEPAFLDEDSSDLVTEAKPEPKAPAGKPDKTIIVQAPPELKVHVKLDDGEPVLIARERFIIGRGPSADLMVKSARVSREHAVVLRDGDEVFIEDLKSSNGTWFDNTRIARRQVSDGEEYLLGGIRITFSLTTES